MQLTLKVSHPKKFVRALSGLFIGPKSPSGLTSREIEMISLLLYYSKSGLITQKTREVVMGSMKMKRQSFYNMMATLKSKGVMEDGELNRLFTSSSVNIKYATDS